MGRRRIRRVREWGITESIVDVVVEGVAVAVVAEPVVVGRELLEALRGDGGEVAGGLGVVGQHRGAAPHEAVDQLLRRRPHLSGRRRLDGRGEGRRRRIGVASGGRARGDGGSGSVRRSEGVAGNCGRPATEAKFRSCGAFAGFIYILQSKYAVFL
jgi:hypothetical protein